MDGAFITDDTAKGEPFLHQVVDIIHDTMKEIWERMVPVSTVKATGSAGASSGGSAWQC